jgi:hypothetical protein
VREFEGWVVSGRVVIRMHLQTCVYNYISVCVCVCVCVVVLVLVLSCDCVC